MTTVLVVDADRRRASRVCPGLEDAGFAVRHVRSAFEALTVVERIHPRVVLMGWDAGDMSAPELASALRRDEALGTLRMVAMVDPGQRAAAAAANGTFDLILGDEECAAPGSEVGSRIVELLDGGPAGASFTGTSSTGTSSTNDASGELDHFSISGHFGLLDLADLVQTICSRRKSGTLALDCCGHRGSVVFEAGVVRHARYRGAEGRAAFGRLFGELRDCGRAPFSFAPMSAEEVRAAPRTIGEPAQLLLLDVAVAQDESRNRLESGREGDEELTGSRR